MVPGTFLALAAWFLMAPTAVDLGIPAAQHINKADIDPAPPRVAMSDPPTVHLGGFDRDCMDCHQILKSRAYPDRLFQHTDIVINHGKGLERGCLECHDKENRNHLALHGGSTSTDGTRIGSVPFSEVAQLCGKCHGPVYSDWKLGMHGRTHGSWDASSGKQTRLTCTQCHDPHSPRYKPMAPLPGPNTRRMGEPTHHEVDPDHQSPLMRRSHGSP